MKKALLLAAVVCSAATTAEADTVNIITQATLNEPVIATSATVKFGFTPTKAIVFNVAGKTCTWNSSADPWNAGMGAGCNYTITVTPKGTLTDAVSNGNGCSDPSAMLRQCIPAQ